MFFDCKFSSRKWWWWWWWWWWGSGALPASFLYGPAWASEALEALYLADSLIVAFFDTSALKEVHISYVISTITAQRSFDKVIAKFQNKDNSKPL